MNPKLFDMKDKTALITGASGFLGFTHAFALAEIGFNLILTDLNEDKLSKLKSKIQSEFPNSNILVFNMDVTSQFQIEKIARILKEKYIKVDVLVNNAAINPIESDLSLNSRLENFSSEQLKKEIDVGLIGTFLCSKIFGQTMAENNYGSIINMASDLSVISPNQNLYNIEGIKAKNQKVKPVSYSIIKTGVIGLTRYLATYWASSNVRVNALSPGGVYNNHSKEFEERISLLIPMGRMAMESELIGAIQYLASDASTYMTGQNLLIDGGRSVW